jgi:vacuolar protein sorting-associated protein 45
MYVAFSFYVYDGNVVFTNVVSHNRLEQLAACDELELVTEVQEAFADVYAINSDLFSLNIPTTVSLTAQQSLWTSYEESILHRIVDGVFAAIVSLRIHPAVRFARSSPLCLKIAQSLQNRIDDEHILFEQMGAQSSAIVLTDRRLDPVTPLLNQWTYQAMCHELIGLDKNRMDLRKAPGVKKEFEEVVMSCCQDKFFEDNLVSNFGDLALNIEKYVSKFQEQTKTQSQKIESIEDMQRFIDQYPEFKKLSGNVSKHVTVVHELSRLVAANNLISVSALEQEIACEDNRVEQVRKINMALTDPATTQLEKLRLVLLYSVRYMSDTIGINQLKQSLASLGVAADQVGLIDLLLEYCRDMYKPEETGAGRKSVMSLIKNAAGFGGIENVYTQHKTMVHSLAESVLKNRLKDTAYPYMESKRRGVVAPKEKISDVVVFVVGGATYEEARDVCNLNTQYKQSSGQSVLLGGTNVLNSKTFLADLAQLKRVKQPTSMPGKD